MAGLTLHFFELGVLNKLATEYVLLRWYDIDVNSVHLYYEQ